jgi:hypothetical protein
MTWRRVAVYWALFVVALVYYAATTPGERVAEGEAETPRVGLVTVRIERLAEVAIARGETRIRLGQEAGRWRVLDPPNRQVPADLLSSFVVTLAEAKVIERVDDDAVEPERFGLERAGTRVDLYERGHDTPVSVILGGENPTQTAIYARVIGSSQVLLVGRVLQYYAGRIFEEVDRRRGS